MKHIPQTVLVVILVLGGFSLLVAGCMGSGPGTSSSVGGQTTFGTVQLAASSSTVSSSGQTDITALSTFKQKDPFIQQALPPTSSTTAAGTTPTTSSGGSTNTTYYLTTTTYYLTTTTYHLTTTTYHGSTTSTTHATTTTTMPHKHTLKVLSVAVVSNAPAVTLQVDNNVYKDKRVGDVLSTSWGQIKILDLSTTSKVVTLLHGSETVVLSAGQQIFE